MSKKPNKNQKLNDQQEMFCREYLVDFNGTRAYMAAYPDAGENTAAVGASRLLRNDKTQAFLKALATARDGRVRKAEVRADDVLQELNRLGYSDIRRIFNDNGTIRDPKDWPLSIARAVASIEVEELFEGSGAERTWIGYTKKVKFWPKDRALEMLAKNQKLLTDKVEHSGKMTLEELVSGAKKGEKKDG